MIAILGGSGLYELAGVEDAKPHAVETPFGAPSDPVLVGRIGDNPVAFLARHGSGHRYLPTEVNYRANLWALKSLGVTRILSASAVGSLAEGIAPRHVVAVDQFIDRTRQRPQSFFGDGIVAHVSMADPVCPQLHRALVEIAPNHAPEAHPSGTYLCMEGPAFSTRAESELYRSWGCDVIGMTNATEARLAREAELCYATLALVTDYDCWHESEDDVTVAAVLAVLRDNAVCAAAILADVVETMSGQEPDCGCGTALKDAIITAPSAIPAETRQRLGLLVDPYLGPA